MDKIKYKGEYALLLDTEDLTNTSRISTFDIRVYMEKYKVKKLIIITTLPFQLLPLSVREVISNGDAGNVYRNQAICYRGEIK
jgi:hypothetical protein